MGTLAIQPNSRRAYALAAGLLLFGVLLQWTMRPLLGTGVPFLFLLPAIGVAAMYGGWQPALLVLAGGAVNAALWLDAGSALGVDRPGGQAALLGYLLAGGVLLAMGGRVSQLRARAVEAENRLEQQVADLQALQALGSRVGLLPTLDEQLQAVLDTACDLQGADLGLLSLCDGEPGTLRVAASRGFSAAALAGELAAVPVGVGACGRAVGEQRVVVVADTETDDGFAPYREVARREGFRAVHSRPLVDLQGNAAGVLSVHFRASRPPTPRDHQLGELCAGMASVLAQRDHAQRRAMASSRKLEVALETSAVPFCLMQPVTGAGGRIETFRWEYLNAAAARVLRRQPSDVAGRSVRESLAEGVQTDPGLLARALEALRSHATTRFETWVEAGGRRRWLDVIASPYDGGLAVWFSDVTSRKLHEEALREADRRKDQFLATLAHELRNPLAPIRQAALVAKSPAATEQQRSWSHGVIERQVGHMAMLLDDLLDVSRITRGKLVLRRSFTPVAGIVDAALEAARPLIEHRRQQLQVRLPPQPVWVDADPLRLAQVLSNLLTNASKYTPEGGHVTLAVEQDGQWLLVSVQDDGAGIAADALDRIFEMFTQVRGGDGGRSGGLGIGLALSRGLVELHGGRLEARSDGLGRGSVFTVSLPGLVPEPAPPAPAAAPAAAVSGPCRILVADDNRDAAQSLGDLLRMEGHEVAIAFDGQDALDQFDSFAPEVALLDIGMPRRTGNEVASAIRSRPQGRRTLLVAITGWGQAHDRDAARAAGFDVHFTKPVDPQQLLQLLQSRAGKRPSTEPA
jgi:signal transduction histidine kinase/ActR/RegA family two-component response regulator